MHGEGHKALAARGENLLHLRLEPLLVNARSSARGGDSTVQERSFFEVAARPNQGIAAAERELRQAKFANREVPARQEGKSPLAVGFAGGDNEKCVRDVGKM